MRKALPIILAVVGLIVFGIGAALTVGSVNSSLSAVGDAWTVPGSASQQLAPGNYAVYEAVDSPTGGDSPKPTVDPNEVRVTGPSGPVALSCLSCGNTSMTVSLGSQTYAGVVAFTAEQAGEYTVEADGRGQELVVGPSVTSTFGSAAKGIGLIVLGGLMTLIGVVWLIVVLIVSKPSDAQSATGAPGPAAAAGAAAPAAPASPATTPAGWYPDPDNPSQQRYWDGSAWTDHRHQG